MLLGTLIILISIVFFAAGVRWERARAAERAASLDIEQWLSRQTRRAPTPTQVANWIMAPTQTPSSSSKTSSAPNAS